MINEAGIPRDVLVLGASAGGVEALGRIFSALPPDLNAVIGVVLHRSPVYNVKLALVLGRHSKLSVVEPEPGEPIRPGVIYLAPRDHHLTFNGTSIELSRGPKENFTRPAIDPLFSSAAKAFGQRVVGVLLTGGGADGVRGLVAIKESGGLSITQDPEEAFIPSMPINALRQDDVDLVVRLSAIPDILVRLSRGEAIQRRA
ncbi:chemotaxis protein CheB [Candidatus Nitrospira bockiana]